MSARQFLAGLATLALMAVFGLAVYTVLGTLQTKTTTAVDPTQEQALLTLPGTLFLAQNGSLYSLHGLQFTRLATPPGDWYQVAPGPNGNLLAVAKNNGFSNLYLLSPTGQILRTLLQESSTSYFNNHFVFYPRLSANGHSVFYSYNWIDPAANYNVDFEVQSVPLANPGAYPNQWSTPNNYTGGDVSPTPTSNGGLIYTKYNVTSSYNSGYPYSQLVYVSSPQASLDYLTTPAQNCSEPALNPAGNEIAMICVNNRLQSDTLEVASWNGTSLGPPRVLSQGPMAAAPAWSPSGTSLVFMNVTSRGLPFQLFWIPGAASKKPGAAQQVTQNLSLNALSTPVWYS
ncbi:MAG: TolB-like translocation protein [Candidatus Dormibacteria bacterium]